MSVRKRGNLKDDTLCQCYETYGPLEDHQMDHQRLSGLSTICQQPAGSHC